ncbi:MAG TPA: metalloregulator ArsR/SmtB family transcription factor [Acidimicrobiales bacterium]|nr:metalloregulator ArsR/SmtB family transcription factor [Acidimicrobiales bacterium]
MQIAEEGTAGPGTVGVVGPSLLFDLAWSVHAAESTYLRQAYPPLAAAYGDDPSLAGRIAAMWDDGLGCFSELEVLGWLAGVATGTDLDTVLDGVVGAIATVPADLPLRSETAEVRTLIYRRLAALEGSPAVRRRYVELLRALWGGIDPWWQRHGAPASLQAAEETRAALARGTDWRDLVGRECETLISHLPTIAEEHDDGRPLTLVACAFFGRGLYLDFPDTYLLGFGALPHDHHARVRTDAMARRLRALADPTRLAILDFVGGGPTTVGAVARAFSLAQPTVSAHVKHLREAGLVSTVRQGGRLEISLDRAATADLARDLGELFAG